MAGFLTIGANTLQQDAAWFTVNWQGVLGGTNLLAKTRIMWDITGYVRADPGQTLANSMAQVESLVVAMEACVQEGTDLVFSIGATMRLLSANCISGTHVRSFHWLSGFDGVRGSGAEAVLRRSFRLVIYGDIVATPGSNYTSYSDALTFIGTGGDRTVPVPSLNGNVQAQQIQLYTPQWVLQSGHAKGLTSRPDAATPQFLGTGYYPMPEGFNVTPMTPTVWGDNLNTEFGIRWAYKCWLPTPVQPFAPPNF